MCYTYELCVKLRMFENLLSVDHILLVLFFMNFELIRFIIVRKLLIYILFNELLLICIQS